jgi:hypothetical protein
MVSTPPLQLSLGPQAVPPPVGPAQIRPPAGLSLLGRPNGGVTLLVDLPRSRGTIEFWVKLEQQPCLLLILPNVLTLQVASGQLTLATPSASATSPATPIADGQWHHVALSYADPLRATTPPSTEYVLFLDGAQVSSGTLGGFLPPATPVLATFGSNQGAAGAGTPSLRGQLSQIRVWAFNRAVDQVRATMRQILDGSDPLLGHCYPLHEARGALVWDVVPARSVAVVPGFAAGSVAALTDGSLPFADRGALSLAGDQSVLSVASHTAWAPWPTEPDAGFTLELTLRASAVAGIRTLVRLCAPSAVSEAASLLRINIEDGRFVVELAGMRLLTTSSAPLDRWCHVALIYRSSDRAVSLRVDDASALEAVLPSVAMTRTGTLIIGSERPDAARAAFAGRLSELRLWKTARSPAELRLLRSERLTGFEESLASYYPLTTLGIHQGEERLTSTPDRCRRSGRVPTQDPTVALWQRQDAPPLDQRTVVSFQSSTGQVVIPSRGADVTRSYSVEVWMRLQQLPQDDRPQILLRSGSSAGCFLAVTRSGQLGQGVFVETSAGAVPVELPLTDSSLITPHVWVHLALTHDGRMARLLVNGVPVQEVVTEPPAAHGMALSVGGFIGQLCELRAFYRARTPDEISADAMSLLLGTEDRLYGYWPLRVTGAAPARTRDLGPRGADGQLTDGRPQLTRALSGGDRCLWLDGEQAYARLPAATLRRFAFHRDFTIELWACVLPPRSGSEANRVLLEAWSGAASFQFSLRTTETRGLLLERKDYSQRVQLVVDNVFTDGGMHHIAITVRTGATEVVSLYVDGISRNSQTVNPLDLARGSCDLFFGARGGRSNFLRGGLTEFRMFTGVLSDNEIWLRCYRRLRGDEPLLFAYLPMTGPPLTLGVDRLSNTTIKPAEEPASTVPAAQQGPFLLRVLAAAADARDRARAERARHAANVAALELQAVRARRALSEGEAQHKATLKIVQTSLEQQEKELTARQGSQDLTAVDSLLSDVVAVDSLLSDVVKVTTDHIERARRRIDGLGGRYRLGGVSLSLKYVAGAAGRGAYFPRRETTIDPERVSTLNLDFAPPELPVVQPDAPKIPDLTGYTALAARHILGGSSLRLEVYDQVLLPEQGALVGRILRQSPPPGSEAPEDRTILVFIGKASTPQ